MCVSLFETMLILKRPVSYGVIWKNKTGFLGPVTIWMQLSKWEYSWNLDPPHIP